MKLRSFCGFALIFLSVSRYALTTCTPGTWTDGAVNDRWNDAGNWSGCTVGTFPNASTDSAVFNNLFGSGTITTFPAASITIKSITFNGMGNYTIALPLLTNLHFGGTSPFMNVNAGIQTIDSNVILDTPTTFTIANGAQLKYAGTNAGSISGSTLTINGSGTFQNGDGVNVSQIAPSSITINGTSSANKINITNEVGSFFGLGGTFDITNAVIDNFGFFDDGNTITTIADSTITNEANAIFGATGNAFIDIIMNGGTSFTNHGIVGLTTGGFGVVNITINLNPNDTITNDGPNAIFGDSGLTGTSDITINGGTINNQNGAIFGLGIFENANITINGGTINNSSSFLQNGLNFIMNGGMLTNNGSAIRNVAFTTISGGTILNNAGHTLGGSNFTMDGGTLINDGSVRVGFNTGAANPVFELNGGLVEGKGSFVPGFASSTQYIFANNSGTVMPGDPTAGGGFSPGTLTFAGAGGIGTYQQNSNGTLVIAIDNSSSFGKISANFAQLNGKLLVEGLPDFSIQPGQELIIVQTDPDGLSGTFATIQGINIDSLTPQVRYTTDSAILFFILQAAQAQRMCPVLNCYVGSFYETIITSVNRINIHLEREMEKMRMHFAKNTTRASKEIASISKLSNQLLADNSAWPYVKNAPTESLFADEDWFSVTSETVEKQEIMKREIQTRDEYPLNVYIGPLGSVGDFESRERGRQVGFDYWSAGVLAGFDYVFDQAGVGLLANYERFEGDVDRDWGRFTINEAHAAAYATYAPEILPEMAFDAIVGGGYDWVSIRRNTSTSKAEGHPNTGEFDALFEAEYTFASRQFESFSKNLQVIPLANVQYVYLTIDDYTEHGGSTDFSFNKQRIDSLRSTLGARVNYNWECTNVSFIPELYFAWQREYLDTDHTVRATPVKGGPASFIEIDGVGRNFALVGVDFLFAFYKRWGLELSYDFEWNDLFTDNFFFAGLNVRF